MRWLRVRAARWIYTYHARLTLALFAFFVIPAITFAVWSYQRLRSDDLQTREVLVRETLNAVAAGNEYEQLPGAARRFDTPLFLYTGGSLDRTSDSLLDVLAPTGRQLPPSVELAPHERRRALRNAGSTARRRENALRLQRRCGRSGALRACGAGPPATISCWTGGVVIWECSCCFRRPLVLSPRYG